jgi:hypothetical protein
MEMVLMLAGLSLFEFVMFVGKIAVASLIFWFIGSKFN